MKLSRLLPACLTLLATTTFAAPVPADSHITAVTIYADRAVVTRTADVQVGSAGAFEAVFERLPADLLDQSLQVSGRGEAAAQLVEVAAHPTFVEFSVNERVKALEDQLRANVRDDRAQSDRSAVLGQQRDYVLRIQQATTAPAKEAVLAATPTETWTKLLTFSADQLARISTELQSVDEQRAELKSKREALQQQLNELRGQSGRAYKTVVVRLNATSGGALTLTLRYAVPGASWTPAYDARVNSAEHAVQLGYFGVVRQNTGEDWKGVELTLSTARPSLGGAAPELPPWVVQQAEVRPMAQEEDTITLSPFSVSKERKPAAAPTLAGNSLRAGLKDIASAVTVVATQATSATFKLPEPADVPADHAPHKVGITTIPLKAEFNYTTTPKLLPAAFLTAKVTNASEYPLLGGALNVFLDETFVASSSLATVMPAEQFDLALGADEGITVKRKLNNRFTEDTGLVTKGKRITYDVTITVQNQKKTAEKITVQDQVPVSRHEKIVVKVLAPDAKDAKPDAAGLLKWVLTLAPGEKRELPLKVSVEYPADLPVTGLE
jgi:uncharacterized protein (TIGR02231 family)